MKKWIYMLVVLAVIVAASWWAVSYNAQACDYQYAVDSRTDENCKDTANCTSIYISYPVFSKKLFPSAAVDSINVSVRRQVVGADGKTAAQVIEDFFKDYKDYLAARREFDLKETGDTTGFVPAWNYSAECLVVVNGPELIVTGLKYSQYEGGAHGIYGMNYANYDVHTGRELSLADVFTDTLAVAREITCQFIQQKELDASKPLCDQGYFIQDGNSLPLTPNFALMPDGVVFYYNIYEIAPYYYGASSVTVPYDKLKDFMKYKPDFKGAEVFSADADN